MIDNSLPPNDFSPLARQLGYRFETPDLLSTALTHRSFGQPHNERLEFLGDALLGCFMAEWLYRRFPHAREGVLTRLRAQLVKGETLAEIARHIDLGHYLRLGSGELKSGGWRRTSILADALEAIIGAIYLDAGRDACHGVVLRLYADRLENLSAEELGKDAKTRLQELLQSRKCPLPEYRVLTVSGQAHDQYFEVECAIPLLPQPVTGAAKSRRRAEQIAAEKALSALEAS